MSPTRREILGWGALALGGATIAACSSGGSNSAPSPSSTGNVTDAQSLAALALWTAQQGANAGSYGIGGALVENATGRVLQTMPNRVFKTLSASVAETSGSTFVQDPTAHGERQLMSWYLANRDAQSLPAPEQLTVVTSLDPCLMCASSIMTAGVNVGVIAPDDYSGVNYDNSVAFTDLPEPLRGMAKATFGYYAVDGVRAFSGSDRIAYASGQVDKDTYQQCTDLYSSSAATVRGSRSEADTSPTKLTNPAKNVAAVDLIRAFQVVYPDAFRVAIPDGRRPTRAVYDALVDLVRATPGSTNAVGFLDPFGNLITAAADQQHINRLSTAFALCTRAYAQTRYALVNSPATASLARQSVTNPTFGTFVFLIAPDPSTPEGMFDYGAYGSTMGTAASPYIPSAFQYYELPEGVSERALQDVVLPLPPLYSANIKMQPQRVVA